LKAIAPQPKKYAGVFKYCVAYFIFMVSKLKKGALWAAALALASVLVGPKLIDRAMVARMEALMQESLEEGTPAERLKKFRMYNALQRHMERFAKSHSLGEQAKLMRENFPGWIFTGRQVQEEWEEYFGKRNYSASDPIGQSPEPFRRPRNLNRKQQQSQDSGKESPSFQVPPGGGQGDMTELRFWQFVLPMLPPERRQELLKKPPTKEEEDQLRAEIYGMIYGNGKGPPKKAKPPEKQFRFRFHFEEPQKPKPPQITPLYDPRRYTREIRHTPQKKPAVRRRA
jgi:hypothetical protein